MARTTIPPTRITTGTTAVAYGGVSPIDAYQEGIDRPLAFFESTVTTAISTATATMPCLYVKATNTSGMSGNISATAAHFLTYIGGTATGKLSGLASYVQISTGFVAYAGGLDVSGVITPLNVAIRSNSGDTHTLTSAMMVFGLHAQYLQSGTGDPVYDTDHTNIFFARINSTKAPSALFYFESSLSAGMVAAGSYTTEACQFPLAWIHGAGPTLDHPLYVKLYVT